MAFSEMSSRERTTIIVLAIVIGLAIVGIGVLAARFLIGDGEQDAAITIPAPTTEAAPPATVTLVADVAPESPAPGSAGSLSTDSVAAVQVKSPGNLLPVILTQQPLDGQRQYRVQILAEDGSALTVSGNWSQSTMSAGGKLDISPPTNFKGETPLVMDLDPGIDNPKEWKVSILVKPEDLLGDPPLLILTIWDVTGSE